jgi:hypothetical protein
MTIANSKLSVGIGASVVDSDARPQCLQVAVV